MRYSKKHWEKIATEMVVDVLIRGSMCGRSIPGEIASKRMLELARAESPEAFEKILAEREACQLGFRRIMESEGFLPRLVTPRKRKEKKR